MILTTSYNTLMAKRVTHMFLYHSSHCPGSESESPSGRAALRGLLGAAPARQGAEPSCAVRSFVKSRMAGEVALEMLRENTRD